MMEFHKATVSPFKKQKLGETIRSQAHKLWVGLLRMLRQMFGKNKKDKVKNEKNSAATESKVLKNDDISMYNLDAWMLVEKGLNFFKRLRKEILKMHAYAQTCMCIHLECTQKRVAL